MINELPDDKTASYWLSAIVDSAEDAIVSKTLDGIITSWNKGAQRIFGYAAEEVLGKPILILIPTEYHSEEADILKRIRAGERVEHYETIRQRKDGSLVEVSLTVSPVKTPAGEIVGASKIARDISQSKRAAEQLRESRKMLSLAMSSSRMGAWSRDLATDEVYWSEELEALFGLPAGTFAGNLRGFRDYVYVEDKERIAAEVERAIAERRDYVIEFRFHHGDGSLRWMEGRGQAVYTPEGAPTKIYGIGIDITERKREELDRQFLLELGEKIRFGDFSPEKLLNEVTETTCKHLNASRCLFIEVNEQENSGSVRHEYHKKGLSPVAGEYKISDYSRQTLEAIRSGQIIVNRNAELDPRTAEIYQTTYEPHDERAYISIPLFTDGRWKAVFWVSDDKPREWTAQETAFLETVGERAWLAVEKLRNDEELKQSRERLQMAMDAAGIYSWEMNLATGQIQWSSNLEQVLGFSLPTDYEATVNDLVHPDDRELIAQKIQQAINSGEKYASEFRLVNPETNEIVWVCGEGVLVTDATNDQRRFVGITQNITERKKAEREREELLRREQTARREAEEASRLKDEFLATVSHELRTPLNAIMGWSQMLASGRFNSAEISRAVETIYRNAKSQAQLIEDILDVSRITTGKIRLEPRPVSLSPIIQMAVESLRPAIEAKNIRLRLQLDFEPRIINADPDRLQQVVWNLVSNAIKFTPEKGQVAIRLETDDRQTKIVVTDTGKGISPEFLPFVFERFRQADGSSTRKHGGLGLGLAIVRHIVELHGGAVEAASSGEGAGTTFTVSLPLCEAPLNKVREFDVSNSPNNETNGSPFQTTVGYATIENLKVLIVDDEKDTLDLLAAVLNQKGAEVKAKTSVRDALEVVSEWRPDVIVSDVAMPEEDGYSFIKKLRDLSPEQGGATPAIALTAYVGIKERAKVLESGFQMYVPKPVEPSELLAAIANFTSETK